MATASGAFSAEPSERGTLPISQAAPCQGVCQAKAAERAAMEACDWKIWAPGSAGAPSTLMRTRSEELAEGFHFSATGVTARVSPSLAAAMIGTVVAKGWRVETRTAGAAEAEGSSAPKLSEARTRRIWMPTA